MVQNNGFVLTLTTLYQAQTPALGENYPMQTCEKCQGSMLLDREIDMELGMSLLVFKCINCGRRKQAERAPIPLIEVS